jgi:hypothetical protein
MAIHPWWSNFGQATGAADQLTPTPAAELATALAAGAMAGATLVGLKQCTQTGYTAVHLDVDIERPQDLAHPIRATEPIAVLFPFNGGQPRVLALRDDFPDTPHQNWTPIDTPCSLCIDDRPWAEARLNSTPSDLLRRIHLWLAKAARGELHDTAQPPDPLFFTSALAIVIPSSALLASAEPVELIGFMRPDNPGLIMTRTASDAGKRHHNAPSFVVLAFRAQPQSMTRFRHAPVTLAALAGELERGGINLINEIKTHLKAWAGVANDNVRRLSSRLAIVIAFPVTTADGRTADDLRAFISLESAGDVGVKFGILVNGSAAGAKDVYVRALPENAPSTEGIRIDPAQVHFAFDRDLAAAIAGHSAPDRRRAVLAGAGSLGSQIALDLAREGAFSWTVVDPDYLLPHNLARHALLTDEIGAPKALALARQLNLLLNESFTAVGGDVMNPDGQLVQDLAEAEVIIDASASVAVSRYLADLRATNARRICVFYNPAGISAVLLAENSDRSVNLRDLEAQYHGFVLTEPLLANHLRAEQGVRYSGSCRALTNRIPATKAALLSALAARGIVEALKSDDAVVKIWNATDDGEVRTVKRGGAAVHRSALGPWTITHDDDLLADLARLRETRLPHETGGVLLGIADTSRKSIHVAHALPEPEDSRGSLEGFERGVVGVRAAVNQAVEASMHQLSYVGEWHSHPRRSSPLPSAIDLAQIIWLGNELDHEGLPGLMAIAADDGTFAFVLAEPRSPRPVANDRAQCQAG